VSKRRVVVTGVGIVSPVGIGVSESWNNLLAGKSGIAQITHFDASALSVRIAGEVKGFDATKFMTAKDARRMDVFIQFGMAAGMEAIQDSGITVTEQNAERIGVNLGSGIGGLPLIEETHNTMLAGGARKVSPFFIPAVWSTPPAATSRSFRITAAHRRRHRVRPAPTPSATPGGSFNMTWRK
jgi:3-oxoacyl-[acyl-carrier-protein] synthase II